MMRKKTNKWEIKEETFLAKLSAFWDLLLVGVVIALIYLNQDINYDDFSNNLLMAFGSVAILYILHRMIKRFSRLLDEPGFDYEGNIVSHRENWLLKYIIMPLFFFCAFMILVSLFHIQSPFISQLNEGVAITGLVISTRNLILAGFVFIAIMLVTRFLQRVTLSKLKEHVELGITFKNSLLGGMGYLGVILAFCGLFAFLGANILPIILLCAALLIGIAFGFKDMFQNFVAGLIILMERPIKIGDWIIVEETEGFVRKINLCSTEIETFDKASVLLPNTDITQKKIINWTHVDTIGRTEVKISVAYGTNIEKVRSLLLKIAQNHPSVLDDPIPSVIITDIANGHVEMELRCFIPNKVQIFSIANTLREEIYEALQKAKIKN